MKRFLIPAIISIAAFSGQAQSGIHNPITQAVIKVYTEQIAENPRDYESYYLRANEYYRHNEYLRSMDDINKALEYIPEKETDMRFQALMLRAGIHNQMNRHQEALADLDKAYALEPNNLAVLNQRANTLYTLGQYAKAKADYQRILRLNTRSAEAMVALARIAVKENNLGMANDYLAQAVAVDPNNSDIYLRRANVRSQMNDHNGAVDDLLLALSSDSKNSKALNALVEYGNTNYPAVMVGLTNAIAQAPNVGMFRYLRAVIAQAHYNYNAAIEDYNYIIDNRLYQYHGLYASLAECYYYLADFAKALDNIDRALNMSRDNAMHFVLRSKILRATGDIEEALKAAATATTVDRNSSAALEELAMCYVAKENYKEANNLLGEASLYDSQDPALMLKRAWLLEKYLNSEVAAANFYTQVAESDNFYIDNVRSLKGFALLFLGHTEKADAWMENILKTVDDHDGLINYYGACYWTCRGDNDRALACAAKSMDAGYANYFDWTVYSDGRINVAPLRDDLRFLNLLTRHNVIFGR